MNARAALSRLLTAAALVGTCFAASEALAADEYTQADGVCSAGFSLITPDEARERSAELCDMLGPWDIVRLADGGSMMGWGAGYDCKVQDHDAGTLGGSLCSDGEMEIEPRNFNVSTSHSTSKSFSSDAEISGNEMALGANLLHSLQSPLPFTDSEVDALGELMVEYGRQLQGATANPWVGVLSSCDFPIATSYSFAGGDYWLEEVTPMTPATNPSVPGGQWTTATIKDFDASVIFHTGCGINAEVTISDGINQYVSKVNSAASFIEGYVTQDNVETLGRLIELYGQLLIDGSAGAGALTPPPGGFRVDVQTSTVNGVNYITAVRPTAQP